MKSQQRYVMRDQVKDRVVSIMAHEVPQYGAEGDVPERSVRLLLVGLVAAYAAALTLSGPLGG